MNRVTLFFIFLTVSTSLCAQNVFDYTHSLRYANYLFDTGEFETAAKEYERVIFMADSLFLKQRLVASYRKFGNYDKALNRFYSFYPNVWQAPAPMASEYGKLMLVSRQFDKADSLFRFADSLSITEKQVGLLKTNLLRQDWQQARVTLHQLDSSRVETYGQYSDLIDRAIHQPRKNPVKAALLSVVIPGLGKVYTKDWKDGVVSFLFFGTMAWQSYKGFHRKGVESIPGWAFGALGAGFYVGNIFGTVKAARRFNKMTNEKIYSEVKRLSYSDF